MYLTEKYPECFVEYRPVMSDDTIFGIECVGDSGDATFCEIEKRVDIQRARRFGCKGAVEICDYLNGKGLRRER